MDRHRRALFAAAGPGVSETGPVGSTPRTGSAPRLASAAGVEPGAGGFGRDAGALPPGDRYASHDPGSTVPDFRYPLDGSSPKIATGGWSKEVTSRHFPISNAISCVHMLLNPGGSRELHWHAVAAEWAFVIGGRCQTVVLDPSGASEINNFEPGDLWFFPKAHGHSIQAIGSEPCHFLLAFDNGDTAPEHETFAITDWLDVTPKDLLALEFKIPQREFDPFPKGEVYIQAGAVLPAGDALDAPWPRESTHKFRLMHEPRAVRDFDGGSFRLASMADWPASKSMSGGVMTIRPGAMLELHWHPTSNEMNYVLRGQAQVSLFGSGGRSKLATLNAGDIAYYPQGYGHAIVNTGTEDLELVQVWDNGRFEEIKLTDWVRASPTHLLTNNFAGVPPDVIARLRQGARG